MNAEPLPVETSCPVGGDRQRSGGASQVHRIPRPAGSRRSQHDRGRWYARRFDTPIEELGHLPLYYQELEVVTAIFDPVSQAWSPITPITDNAALDTDVNLSSAGDDRLMLTWLQNAGGEFLSTPASPSTLIYSLWDAATLTWSTPGPIAGNLAGVSSHAAAYRGDQGFVILPRDPDLDTEGDGVLDRYAWDGNSWSGSLAFAAGGVENRVPSVLYDASGEGHVVWLRDDQLVHATLSDPTPQAVRPDSDSASFYDVRFLSNPQGNLTLLWQEITGGGPANLFARIFDPASGLWSVDRRLTAEDNVLHHELGAFYGSDGLLRAAFLTTQIDRTSEEVEINGEMVTLTNLPVEARSDLRLLEHSLIVDLATADAEIAITPPAPETGDEVTVTVTVHNAGDFATGGFAVDIFVGDPGAGGTLVATAAIPGPFAAGDEITLELVYTQPTGGGNVVALIDAFDEITELIETNNTATCYLENQAPFVVVVASVTSGTDPLEIEFDASATIDPEGDPLSFGWIFADGSPSAAGPVIEEWVRSPPCDRIPERRLPDAGRRPRPCNRSSPIPKPTSSSSGSSGRSPTSTCWWSCSTPCSSLRASTASRSSATCRPRRRSRSKS